jgi:hypothetical protein
MRNESAQPDSAGLFVGGFSQMLKRSMVSTLKRASVMMSPADQR